MAKQDNLDQAEPWLIRAKKDYKAYEKVVGQPFLHGKKGLPDDPALAVYLLQQACEKTVKAVAIASGLFGGRQIAKGYGHNSLRLYIDVTLRLIDHPVVGPALDLVRPFLGDKGGKMQTRDSAREELLRIKSNIASAVDREPDTPDWLVEYATLSPEKMEPVLSALLAAGEKTSGIVYKLLRPTIKINVDELKACAEDYSSDSMRRVVAPSFRSTEGAPPEAMDVVTTLLSVLGKDVSLADLIKQAATEEPRLFEGSSATIGKRASIEKSLRSYVAMGNLVMLAAFSFAHEGWTRYPRSVSDAGYTAPRVGLDCDSYDETLGIVACLRDFGRLCQITIHDIDHSLDVVADLFSPRDT